MKKRICSLLLGFLMMAGSFGIVSAGAVSANVTLRVGLYYESSALDTARLENVDTAGYTLGYYSSGTFVPVEKVTSSKLTMILSGDTFRVADTDSGKVLYSTTAGADNLAIQPNSRLTWFKGYKWYGNFEYRRASNGKIAVINYVGLEDYVKGVLPYEVSADWPVEALKAQAICARSYALGSLDKHKQYGFDLCNTTNCQVYRGANLATENSNNAVDLTKGKYLSYNGALVVGYFFSSDGGATEDATNVWGGDYPYLKGKQDPYENVEGAQNGVWSVTLTATEIKQKLAAASYSIGTVANVQVTQRTAMDNVYEVTVTDTSGKAVKLTKSAVRTVFGLNSIRYTVKGGGTASNAALTVKVSTHKISVDGAAVSPQGYLIGQENYFKLRDIASILNKTNKHFNVTWNGSSSTVNLVTGTAYQPVGGELGSSAATGQATISKDKVQLNGNNITLTGYKISGNNYYRIRDVASAIGFAIDYDSKTSTVLINSAGSYAGDAAGSASQGTGTYTSFTFSGTGWGHSVGMSQYGALAMAQKGFSAGEILKFYYTGITIETAS